MSDQDTILLTSIGAAASHGKGPSYIITTSLSPQEPNPVLSESMEEGEGQGAVELAMSWKRKLYVQRAKESISAPRGARGLRKLNKFRISTPSVVDVIKPSDENMKSPTKY